MASQARGHSHEEAGAHHAAGPRGETQQRGQDSEVRSSDHTTVRPSGTPRVSSRRQRDRTP
ncbi:hypothetical protein CcI49_29035 [Frankia sp. CcI49]|nr:hypothetical protein CcI49_29035 [Frankia sp. CcI49]